MDFGAIEQGKRICQLLTRITSYYENDRNYWQNIRLLLLVPLGISIINDRLLFIQNTLLQA
jgi:hypothetical protein